MASGAALSAGIVLEGRELKKNYGSGPKTLAVLVDANIILHEGEMVAIVAPSGAGKSTLLHVLAALDTPTSGTVYFANRKPLKRIKTRRLRNFAIALWDFSGSGTSCCPILRLTENVAMPLLLRGENFTSALGMARKWLAEVGLENRAGHRAGELSGGEQQRVCDCPGACHRAGCVAGR